MSGGHFNYQQYQIGQIADEIEQVISDNDSDEVDDWGCAKGRHYDDEVMAQFKCAVNALKKAQVYAHRIDWLLSNDDGPESFKDRLDEELKKLELIE